MFQNVIDLLSLIDCKKVWKDVNLEQVVYIYQHNSTTNQYSTGSRVGNKIVIDTQIDKNLCRLFEFWICGITCDEIALGVKIYNMSEKLKKHIHNNRGCMLQNKIKKNGDIKIFGGSQIQRYHIIDIPKGYLDISDIDDAKAYVHKNSILAQRIVSHINNPIDHLKITATITPPDIDFVILDTVNHITVTSINPYYVLGLLNSKIVNWYAYRFIFAKAIRTMQFDNPATDRIPIILDKERTVVQKVEKLIKLYKGSKQPHHNNHNTTVENDLNCIFYDIFDLTDDEIRMVEESMPK